MTTFPRVDSRDDKNLKVSSRKTSNTGPVPTFYLGRCNDKNPTGQERIPPRNYFRPLLLLSRLLLLLLTLGFAPTLTLAGQERPFFSDPTGVWITTDGLVILNTFHSDGTFSGDVQGESAFVPGNENPGFQITSPDHGLWQRTGARTFAGTSFALEYNDDGSFYAIFKFKFTGVLNGPGDQMDLTSSGGNFDLNGNLIPGSAFEGRRTHWVRQRLELP
jgi:hypothetical protein